MTCKSVLPGWAHPLLPLFLVLLTAVLKQRQPEGAAAVQCMVVSAWRYTTHSCTMLTALMVPEGCGLRLAAMAASCAAAASLGNLLGYSGVAL